MPDTGRRLTSRPLVLALALALPVTGLWLVAAPPADAARCAPASRLLSSRPTVRHLPGGATMRTWRTGLRASREASVRIVAVTVPPSSRLRSSVYHAGSLSSHRTVRAIAGAHGKAVVVVNGSVYQTSGAGLPAGSFVSRGMVKLSPTPGSSLTVTRDGRAGLAMVELAGSVRTSDGTSIVVNGVNVGSLARSGVSVYTPGWGTRRHPHGSVELLVKAGKVTRVRPAGERGARVRTGSVAITANGTAATKLRALRTGDAVTVAYRAAAKWQDSASAPADPAAAPVETMDLGKRVLRAGVVVPGDCGARDETRRPRTAVGWKKDGTMIVMVVSGRPNSTGAAIGGATNAQVGVYLKRLGAVDGSKLDGGGSTTMYVRFHPGGALHRVDRPQKAPLRKVSNAFGLELP